MAKKKEFIMLILLMNFQQILKNPQVIIHGQINQIGDSNVKLEFHNLQFKFKLVILIT